MASGAGRRFFIHRTRKCVCLCEQQGRAGSSRDQTERERERGREGEREGEEEGKAVLRRQLRVSENARAFAGELEKEKEMKKGVRMAAAGMGGVNVQGNRGRLLCLMSSSSVSDKVSESWSGRHVVDSKNMRRRRRRRARDSRDSVRQVVENERRELLRMNEQRIELIEKIVVADKFGAPEGVDKGFGAMSDTEKRRRGREELKQLYSSQEGEELEASQLPVSVPTSTALSLDDSDRQIRNQQELVQRMRSRPRSFTTSPRTPLNGKRLLDQGYPLLFLGGLPKVFDADRWLVEYLMRTEKRLGYGPLPQRKAQKTDDDSSRIIRVDPVVVSPEEWRTTSRLSGRRSPPCKGYAIISISNDEEAKKFIEEYNMSSDMIMGKECVLRARKASRSEVLRLKRHPSMKGLMPKPFVPKKTIKDETNKENCLENASEIEALSSALNFARLVPDGNGIMGSIEHIAEGSLQLGKWKTEGSDSKPARQR